MTKAELDKIMKRYDIVDITWEDAIWFVHDMLEAQMKETKEREPYATKTISELKDAMYHVSWLPEYIDEAMKEE